MPPVRYPPAAQGAQSNYMNLAGEPADHALGRSRGCARTAANMAAYVPSVDQRW